MTAALDTDKHERVEAPLHPEVVQHAEEYAASVRHYKRPAEVIAAADALLAFARGEPVEASLLTDEEK